MPSRKEVTQFIDKAVSQLGATYEGLNGRGHHVLRLPTGEEFSLPSSPSKPSWSRNAWAEMTRGQPRTRYGKGGRKKKPTQPVRRTSAVLDFPRVRRLEADLADCEKRLRGLAQFDTRSAREEADRLRVQIGLIHAELRRLRAA